MKTMTKDEFAIFIADVIKSIDNYNFDVLYDITKIMKKLSENRANSKMAIKEELHLMVRPTGCDLYHPNDDGYAVCINRATTIYKLVFCWNEAYFPREDFCTVETIKL